MTAIGGCCVEGSCRSVARFFAITSAANVEPAQKQTISKANNVRNGVFIAFLPDEVGAVSVRGRSADRVQPKVADAIFRVHAPRLWLKGAGRWTTAAIDTPPCTDQRHQAKTSPPSPSRHKLP